jgi:hypothetical protein
MGKLTNVNRIIADDFPEETRETMEQLAETLNPFMEQTFNVLNGNVDFNNLSQKVVVLDVIADASGIPTNTVKFSAPITNARGGMVINARNLQDSSVFPTSAVQVFFSPDNSGLYKLNKITGLQANTKYQITLILVQ